ncbi:NUDIX domain-containing protein [candidate division KSB1 bacterium]|nr:NUDIX domain-containing protein [candidate division KSB1 bacterium]
MSSEKEIMVVDRSTLFADEYFQGYCSADQLNYTQIILDNYFYEKRSLAEKKPEYKQPIAYCLIVNPESEEIFTYQRSAKAGDYNETRLRGKWSWGIGGHIDKVDEDAKDPILTSLLRELNEEILIEKFKSPEILGYINDDDTEVGQVHFGVLYLVKTTGLVKPKDPEIAWGGFMSLESLEEICMEEEKAVESWSEIALEPLRVLLNRKEEFNGQ